MLLISLQGEMLLISLRTGRDVAYQPTGRYVAYKPTGRYNAYHPTGRYDAYQPTGSYVAYQPTGRYVAYQPTGRYDAYQPTGRYVAYREIRCLSACWETTLLIRMMSLHVCRRPSTPYLAVLGLHVCLPGSTIPGVEVMCPHMPLTSPSPLPGMFLYMSSNGVEVTCPHMPRQLAPALECSVSHTHCFINILLCPYKHHKALATPT
jgi:hypothetical protein